jgi:hypothetical protein
MEDGRDGESLVGLGQALMIILQLNSTLRFPDNARSASWISRGRSLVAFPLDLACGRLQADQRRRAVDFSAEQSRHSTRRHRMGLDLVNRGGTRSLVYAAILKH